MKTGDFHLIHCSYHKCLTVYFSRVMGTIYNRVLPGNAGYMHFNSFVDNFYAQFRRYRVASVNNHMLRLADLGQYRLTRFVRDPRDLIVSGYFYHKRGAEPWCNVVDPTERDWTIVNGCVPAGVGPGQSYASYLQGVSEEEGLLAEIEFRRFHFESMRQWPSDDPGILMIRYEEVLDHEVEMFRRIFSHYQLPMVETLMGRFLAARYSAKRLSKRLKHIRNPKPHQWKKHFTRTVEDAFMDVYGDLLSSLGYG